MAGFTGKVTFEDFMSRFTPMTAVGSGRPSMTRFETRRITIRSIASFCPTESYVGCQHVAASTLMMPGKPARLLGISIDITARKQAELDAQRDRAELSHLSRVALMGEMSASIAHELNQPLGWNSQ